MTNLRDWCEKTNMNDKLAYLSQIKNRKFDDVIHDSGMKSNKSMVQIVSEIETQ